MKQKLLRFIPARLRNRYGLGIAVFLLYVCFLSDYDLYTTLKLRHKLHGMQQQHEYYAREIKTTREQLGELNGDQASREKFAREKYLMKRDDEDLFVFRTK